ncbi:MAG TPA: hypothetical protein VNI52_09725 [Sphingobacteriaceae bacterium]|nr:hypothetical protein [Sphingobacteriaceae bacterium]
MILTLQQRLDAFIALGEYLRSPDTALLQLMDQANQYNAWFTSENTKRAVLSIGEMLNPHDVEIWLKPATPKPVINENKQTSKAKKIGLVLAGNIPLVGFHDILCVLAAGHIALIKLSSQDQEIIPHILKKLIELEPAFSGFIHFVERLENFDGVIATGSTNTSRYFEYYFGKVPHIIRKNRNSVAVLTGKESEADLTALGHDIFDYYGLGCRNVSKIFIPEGFDFIAFFEGIEQFSTVGDHHKYHNNYDYNKSILLLNRVKHFDNGFLLVKNDEGLASSLAVLHYEEYKEKETVIEKLNNVSDHIQCIVSAEDIVTINHSQKVNFGQSQYPRLWDYADGIDTMNFLTTLQ